MPRLPPSPRIDWSDESAPRAIAFDDVYFSREGGLAESDAVFLAGCGLPDAWKGRARFNICELGFGSGLNILSAWRVWQSTREPHAILHISSIEAFPLERTDAARLLRPHADVEKLAAELIECWPVRAYGAQRFWFNHDRVMLTLHVGDAAEILSEMVGAFDAWFLDGFAPARNPEMWNARVYEHIARLSAPGARLATFSVAGDVRRGLSAVNFDIEKKSGFGSKRQRLQGRFNGASISHSAGPAPKGKALGGKAAGAALFPYIASRPKRVAILGAGIAGASCAWALSKRGVETIVLDAAPSLGAGASGNPAGLVMPRLDRGGVLREFFVSAYLHAVAAYDALDVWEARGIEERAEERRAAVLEDLILDPPLPPDWFAAVGEGAAWHARAGVIRPLDALARMLDGAALLFEAPVETLERAQDGWILRAPDGRARLKADAVVLACGAALTRFEPAKFLPIELTRGQIEWGQVEGGHAPAHAIIRGGYVAPFAGGALFGATFDKLGASAEVASDQASRLRNLASLQIVAPEIAALLRRETLQSRASVRAATSDNAPIVGALPDAEAWLKHYAALAHGRPIADGAPPAHDGIYVLGGLGARGLTLAPILGERLASEMFGEPQILAQRQLNAIHPARFLLRALKRGLPS